MAEDRYRSLNVKTRYSLDNANSLCKLFTQAFISWVVVRWGLLSVRILHGQMGGRVSYYNTTSEPEAELIVS